MAHFMNAQIISTKRSEKINTVYSMHGLLFDIAPLTANEVVTMANVLNSTYNFDSLTEQMVDITSRQTIHSDVKSAYASLYLAATLLPLCACMSV